VVVRARVLVVDDDQNARAALAEILTDEGCIVDVAADGREALDKARSFRPDLVLADVQMPRMNGIKLRDALRGLPDPPLVIFMTGEPLPRGTGETFVLTKPIGEEDLLSMVRAALAWGARGGGAPSDR
jgi:CheY-like chemotaxis protein